MRSRVAAALLAASLSSSANAAVLQTCPTSDSKICYSLNVPDTTASSGNGDIYFQISAPTTYSWVALGQGSRMAGSNIFVIYTSADGQNVTLSPRLGKGHVMPMHDTAADVTLLEGSGVSDGMMTANVKCSNCNSWTGGTMDFTSSGSTNWIYAALSGPALDSDDVTETISYHDLNDPFTINLADAKGGSDVNPFVSAATTTGASASAGASMTTGTMMSTGTAQPTNSAAPQIVSAPSESVSDNFPMLLMAHGIMAAVAFALIFPIGGIIIRVANFTGLTWVHAAIQALAFLVFTAAFGLGIYIARTLDLLSNHHPIIGIVVFAILVFQPVLGLLHHMVFKKTGERSVWSYAHLGIGRTAIILGTINGGLGLRLADNAATHWVIAYSVVAGVFGVAYIASAVFGESKRQKNKKAGSHHEKSSDRDVSMESAIPPQEKK